MSGISSPRPPEEVEDSPPPVPPLDEPELLELIRSASGLTETEKKCREYVAGNCDGHSIERIIQLIEEVKA